MGDIYDLGDYALLIFAGLGAGAINAAVGSGTLISYPALLAIGLPPVGANATNTFAMAPGNLAAAWMYRHRLYGRKRQLTKWALATSTGALVGVLLVILLPSEVFAALIPWLILSACGLIAVQPLIQRGLRNRRSVHALTPALGLIGIYGGYFGAGQGIAYLAVLGSLDDGDIQDANAVKNLMASAANATAAVVFLFSGHVTVILGLVLALAAVLGGLIGGGAAKRAPTWLLRAIVIAVGVFAAVQSFLLR